jgi:hypothetical protein
VSGRTPTERLRGLVATWTSTNPAAEHTALLVELLERREADLPATDVGLLQWLRSAVREDCDPGLRLDALTVFDRLIGGAR